MQIMAVPSAGEAASGPTSGSAIRGSNDMFMQLLMAELQTQNPLSPMDPNQMVNQLVQLNTLKEITSIRELLQQLGTIPDTPVEQNTQGGQ
jgi:flagellar basal-body rod modification protein FlgD